MKEFPKKRQPTVNVIVLAEEVETDKAEDEEVVKDVADVDAVVDVL